jgi:hypothetical protein
MPLGSPMGASRSVTKAMNSDQKSNQRKKVNMDKSFHPKESNMQQQSGFLLASLRIFDSILPLMRRSVKWLAGFFQLTEEEQENAGVFLGRLGNE